MSRAAKSILVFLLLLLFVSVGLLTYVALQKQEVDKAKISLEKQIDEFQGREKKYILENKDLQEKLKVAEKIKTELQEKLSSFDGNMEDLDLKLKELSQEREGLQEKVKKLEGEREKLLAQLKEKAEPQVVYKYVDRDTGAPVPQDQLQRPLADKKVPEKQAVQEKPVSPPSLEISSDNENYWAQVIKEKTALELETEDLQGRLEKSMLELEEMKKRNSDLELGLSELNNEKESIERKIKHGNDLADNLSLELARSENDKKFLNGRLGKMNDENTNLRNQIKGLTSTKIALEKSIVRLQDEKKTIERKLLETENIIQNRIDEIWDIKDSLEKNFKSTDSQASGEVELPPIVVSSSNHSVLEDEVAVAVSPGFDGNVVSVNDENNFVIVDLGESDGLKLGDNMSVYRGAEYVAALEVIQVRSDIAAADIKNKVTTIQVGDTVR